MWVVKLGGSLWRSDNLKSWLACVAGHGAGKAVLVPGGGPFADTVREVQTAVGFSDPVAHRMALLGMCQYGLMLSDLGPAFQLARDETELRHFLASREVPIWLPFDRLTQDQSLPENWTVTSDSLAAKLAAHLGAEHLVLIKSIAPRSGSVSVTDLAREGVVDQALPDYLAGANFKTWWLGPADADRLAMTLSGQIALETQIIP
jgi:aspartokinase-like uncharacterized kinase